jgi:hypothetical protein
MVDLTDLVRSSCRAVVAGAQLVAIDDEALARLADELTGELATAAARPTTADRRRPPRRSAQDVEASVALVVALDAINFGSGWHDVVRKSPGSSGARTMAAALRAHAGRHGPLTAPHLAALTPARCADIFGQDPSGEAGELVALFARSLNELGHVVAERHDGSFTALVEGAAGSAVALADSLLALGTYRDRVVLDGRQVHFYKRAQITPADLWRELPDVGCCAFTDLDRLTAFADNLVPHVLRVDGVLRYDHELAAAIDAGSLLAHGSRGEVEIRAAGVEAVERLVGVLAGRDVACRPMDVDLALWQRGAGPRYKAVRRHRSCSTAY